MKVVNSIKVFVAELLLLGLLLNSESLAANTADKTRIDSAGGVKVKVTLLDSKANGDLRFEIALDTHSVNLDSYDLKTVSVLRDGAGNVYLPKAVENMGSGHHRQSTVQFGKLADGTKRLELVIKDIAGVKERVFRWDLP